MKRALAAGCLGVLAGLVVVMLPLVLVQPSQSILYDARELQPDDSRPYTTVTPWTSQPLEVFGLTSASFSAAFLTYIGARQFLKRRLASPSRATGQSNAESV